MATRSVSKPGVGEVILKTRWWRPDTVTRVLFRPAGTDRAHRVAVDAVGDLLAATSVEQAMAVVRHEQP